LLYLIRIYNGSRTSNGLWSFCIFLTQQTKIFYVCKPILRILLSHHQFIKALFDYPRLNVLFNGVILLSGTKFLYLKINEVLVNGLCVHPIRLFIDDLFKLIRRVYWIQSLCRRELVLYIELSFFVAANVIYCLVFELIVQIIHDDIGRTLIRLIVNCYLFNFFLFFTCFHNDEWVQDFIDSCLFSALVTAELGWIKWIWLRGAFLDWGAHACLIVIIYRFFLNYF